MKTMRKEWRKSAAILVAVGLLGWAGCAEERVKPEAALDTPEHHYSTGNRLVATGDYDGAMKEYQRAVALDPEYAPGHAGIGLVYGLKGMYTEAYEAIGKARKLQKPPMVIAQVMRIRVLSMERREDWLSDAESAYKEGQRRDPNSAELHYYMGIAYRRGYQFGQAAERFQNVLALNKDYVKEADKEWKLVQKIQRAAPGTMIGTQIALVDQITRADVAALFIQELNIDRLFEKKGKTFDPSFKAPGGPGFQAEKVVPMEPATDIANHPLKADKIGRAHV